MIYRSFRVGEALAAPFNVALSRLPRMVLASGRREHLLWRGGRMTKHKGLAASFAPALLAATSCMVGSPMVATKAFAANECGAEAPGADTLNCNAAAYPAGITYTNSDGLTLNVNNGAMVVGPAAGGVQVTSGAANTNNITVNGTSFSTITTTGANGRGLGANNVGTAGNASSTLSSGTINTSGTGAVGVFGQISNANNAGTASATITGGSVVTTGNNAYGAQANTTGTGGAQVSISNGTVTTSGTTAHGGFASVNNANATGVASATMSSGQIQTSGGSAVGLNATSTGRGGATAEMTGGTITTTAGGSAWGIQTSVSGLAGDSRITFSGGTVNTRNTALRNIQTNANSTGNATTDISGGTIQTTGSLSYGAEARVTNQVGNATITMSGGSITTDSTAMAHGLVSWVSNTSGTGAASVTISDDADIDASGFGGFTYQQGLGTSSVRMEGGTVTGGDGLIAYIENASNTNDAVVTMVGGTITAIDNVSQRDGSGLIAQTVGSGDAVILMTGGTVTAANIGILALGEGTGGYDVDVTAGSVTGGALPTGDGINTRSANGGTIDISSGVIVDGSASGVSIRDGDANADEVDEIGGDAVVNTAGTLSGDAILGLGDDIFNLTGGSLDGFVWGDSQIASAQDGDDTFTWTGGTLTGGFHGQNGSDTATVSTTNYNGSQVLDGGDDVAIADGWIDSLTLQGLTVSTNGANLINWETLTVNGGQLTILDGAITVGSDPGYGMFLTGGGNLEALNALTLTGNLDIDSGSTFIGTGGGAGVYTVTGSVFNAGTITTQDNAVGDTFTVGGNYNGDGGQLLLDTYLGDDGSASDRLIIEGNSLGSTTVLVFNVNGPGAQTTGDGIQIVQVDGTSDGTFVLGNGPLVAGAYSYNLFQNGVADPTDGDWYLRSSFSPTTPTYEVYPQVLITLNDLPTLQQRVGNRYWNEPAPKEEIFCKDPAQNYRCVVTDDQANYYADGQVTIEQNAIWGRIEGAHGHMEPQRSTTETGYDYDLWKLQAGVDAMLAETDSGKLIGGINVHYGHASSDTFSVNGDGSISSDGYGVGATLTWYGENGFYVDGQGQYTWYDSDLSADNVGSLVEGNDATGYALSIEAGKRLQVDEDWTVTPQAQLVYSSVDFDSFTGPNSETVSLEDGESLRARAGISADRQRSWKADDDTIRRSHLYAIANVHYEFLDGTKVSVSGTNLENELGDWTGELGIGGTCNWNDDKYSIYGEVDASTGLEDFGDSYEISGTIGLRSKW